MVPRSPQHNTFPDWKLLLNVNIWVNFFCWTERHEPLNLKNAASEISASFSLNSFVPATSTLIWTSSILILILTKVIQFLLFFVILFHNFSFFCFCNKLYNILTFTFTLLLVISHVYFFYKNSVVHYFSNKPDHVVYLSLKNCSEAQCTYMIHTSAKLSVYYISTACT